MNNLKIILVLLILACCNGATDNQYSIPDQELENPKTNLLKEIPSNGRLGEQEALLLLEYYKTHTWKSFEPSLIRLDSLSPLTSYLLIAEYYYFQRDFQNALSCIEKSEVVGYSDVDLYALKAKVYTMLKMNDSAIDQINRAILINRYDADLYLEKGLLYLVFGDTLSGINYIEKSFDLDSARVDVVIKLATLNSLIGEMAAANEWLLRGIEGNPESTELLYVQVAIFRDQLFHGQANGILSGLLQQGEVKAGIQLIDWFTEQGFADSLLFYSNSILEIDSMNVEALLTKGDAFDVKGYFSSSKKYYEQVITIDSLNEEAIEGVQKVDRKIAYLRKLKERKESLPTFDFLTPSNTKTLNE